MALGLLTWLVTVVAGLGMLWAYADTPGAPASPTVNWPAGAALARDARGPVLVMFLHPRCPCSRATVAELARLLADAPPPAAIHALVYRPSEFAPGWEHTDLWQSAAAIRGVQMTVDVDGEHARAFGARVSGHTMLYSATGALLFSGGITAARGHEGDNAGRQALTSILTGGRATLIRTPVFGCYLHAEPDAGASRPVDQERP